LGSAIHRFIAWATLHTRSFCGSFRNLFPGSFRYRGVVRDLFNRGDLIAHD
jgi:hypothetical protein